MKNELTPRKSAPRSNAQCASRRSLRAFGLAAGLAMSLATASAWADGGTQVLMSPQWAKEACAAWNQTPQLTDGLKGEFMHDDKGRGYKLVEMYRTDCGKASVVELKLQLENDKAMCVSGGAPTLKPNFDVDFLMHADTKRWEEMGKGDYGPMKAMMFGRLEFQGPKLVAMRAMDPFSAFLLLVGKVPADTATCPKS